MEQKKSKVSKPKKVEPVEVADPKVVEVTVKVSDIGKVSLVVETKKDITKLYKKAISKLAHYLEKELEKLED